MSDGPDFIAWFAPDRDVTVVKSRGWEGAVDEIGDGWFGAHLKPILGDAVEAHAEFTHTQVADFDLPLIEPGALFWFLAETVKRRGQVEVRSQLRFRRVEEPEPSYSDLVNAPLKPETVEALAQELASKDPARYRKAGA